MRRITYIDRYWIAQLGAGLTQEFEEHLINFHATRAHAADKYRKATGRRHPDWGNGSLNDQLFHSYKSRLHRLYR